MADVIDVVHKITYEVDDKALQNAVSAINEQITELSLLSKTLAVYQKQLQTLKSEESHHFKMLNSQIESLNKAIEKSTSKVKGVFEEIGSGLKKGLGANLEDTVSDFTQKIQQHLLEMKMPVTDNITSFEELGNVIENLGKSAAPVAVSGLGAVTAGVFSFANVAPVVISLLTTIVGKFLETEDATLKYKKALEAAGEEGGRIGDASSGEIANLLVLRGRIQDVTVAYGDRVSAVNELLSQYPDYFEKLSKEEILAGKVGDAYERIVTNILNNARLQVFNENLKESLRSLEKAKKEVEFLKSIKDKDNAVNLKNSFLGSTPQYLEENDKFIDRDLHKKVLAYNKLALKVDEDTRDILAVQKEIDKTKPKPAKGGNSSSGGRVVKTEKTGALPKIGTVDVPVDSEADELMAKDLAKNVATNDASDNLEERISAINTMELWQNTEAEKAYANGLKTYEEYEKQKLEIKQRFAKERLKEEIANLKGLVENKDIPEADKEAYRQKLGAAELELVQTTNAEKHNKEVEDKKAKDDAETKRQARIKETVAAYQNLAAEAVKAINTIYDAQIKSLDNEIKVRERRVEQAKKLAERGNAEVLKMEEERLAEAQKKKEAYAKKEAILNAALAFSNSLVAVTGAVANAVKGDPYTVAARVAAAIAAVLAALGSGYAFVQSFKSEGAFADGVVDFRGKGGPRDDANWVRISSGESVITAEGTRQNRQLLEAINSGAKLQFFNPALAYTTPVFASPGNSAQNYASQNDLRNVETKLDGVITAIEDNRMKQNIFFDEHGVGLMTERAMRKDRRRWK